MSAATILSSFNAPNSPILISPTKYHISSSSNEASTRLSCCKNESIRDSEEFRSNKYILSESFKHIPSGLIASLLESVSNDLNKAQQVIKQISDTSCTHVNHRKRGRPEWSSSFSDEHEPCKSKLFKNDFSKSSNVQSACSCSTTEEATKVANVKVNQMKKIQKMLAKVVVNQFEKLNLMQVQNNELTAEQAMLKDQVQQLQSELQQANHKNTVLSYMISTFNQTQNFSMIDHNRPIF